MRRALLDLKRILGFLCLTVVLTPGVASFLSSSTVFPASSSSSDVPSSDGDDIRWGTGTQHRQKPNIIIILADDMGWNDVSFHGSDQIPTPNIDALAYNGVILNSHYVSALCTPSRASLMTGKYPIRLGMQHSVILAAEPRGLPLSEKLLPEYLKEAGYNTHAIGKWHLGFYKKEYTPTYRGFDTHFGYWNGLQDYYNHSVQDSTEEYSNFIGFDMRRNMSLAWNTLGKYSTDLFTEEAVHLINNHDTRNPMFMYVAHLATHSGNDYDPMQAPDDEIAKFSYIKNPERRVYAAMVSKLDQSIGDITSALRNRGMLDNSIIIFLSDNGAPTSGIFMNHGSNYPLRGMKESPWEGGVRGVAAVWSPLIKESKRVSNQMFHVTDWLPTLLSAAGINTKKLRNIDGKDLWPTLVSNKSSPRTQTLINIDDVYNYSAYRRGDFKYVLGTTWSGNTWEGETGRQSNEDEEGVLPPYNTRNILQSKTGVAIAGVITAAQVMEMKQRRRRTVDQSSITKKLENNILSEDKLLQLRKEATVECNVAEQDRIPCYPSVAACLFDIAKDPCEMINIAESRPLLVTALEIDLLKYRSIMLPAANMEEDPAADPKLWNNTWTNWGDHDALAEKHTIESTSKYSGTVVAIVAVIVGLLIVGTMILIARYRNRTNTETKNILSHDTTNTSVESRQGISLVSETVQNIRDMSTINDLVKNIN